MSLSVMSLFEGFTELSEKCSVSGKGGAEQLSSILNSYLSNIITEVLKINGDVLKFAGT